MTRHNVPLCANFSARTKPIMLVTAWFILMTFSVCTYASGSDSSGTLTLRAGGGDKSAMHLATTAEILVKGLQAKVIVTQDFKNDSKDWVDAVYAYPLPDDSAIHDLRMHIGERVIVAEILEKVKAKKIYEKAKAGGIKTALLEQQRPNIFSQKIANIAPGEMIKIKISYIQPVLYESGRFRLRFPMTLTPRYIPGIVKQALAENESYQLDALGWASPTDLVPDAHRITPPWTDDEKIENPISLIVKLEAGIGIERITSATHDILTRKNKRKSTDIYNITLANKTVAMDRDFELVWEPAAQSAPVAAMFNEGWGKNEYIQLLLMPPRELSASAVLSRELLLVIDTSGSMDGPSMRQAKESALIALNTLKTHDRFNLIDFNNEAHALFSKAVEVSQENLTLARDYINNLNAGGGTEMQAALALAFSHEVPNTHLQQIVFVTDGSVGNEVKLLTQIRRGLGKARLFTVAIGSAPNRYFMQEAAKFGRGSLTEISTVNQVQERMTELLHKLQNPVVANLKIQWPQPVEAYPKTIPDLYWGEPLLVVAKLKPWPLEKNAAITITGITAGKPWRREISLANLIQKNKLKGQGQPPMLAKYFGRKKINHLEREFHDRKNSTQAKSSILDVALHYGLMSRFTSLVAVDKKPSRALTVPVKQKLVPNLRVHGSTLKAVAYPQTATNLWGHLLMGLLAFIVFVLMQRGGKHYAQVSA